MKKKQMEGVNIGFLVAHVPMLAHLPYTVLPTVVFEGFTTCDALPWHGNEPAESTVGTCYFVTSG